MSQVATLGSARQAPREWPRHDAAKMERDFRFWRHTRVARARIMRRVHRVASLFCWSSTPATSKTAYGVRMHPDWQDRSYAYCHYATYGTYLADIIRSIECPFVFVDLGANQGVFSLIAALQPSCKRVVAVEPVAATYDRLVGNIELNNLQDRVTALEFGVSDHSGVRMMRRERAHSGVATLEDHISASDRSSISQPVNVRTVEDLCTHIPAGLPIFVKVDVAGHEATVIEQLMRAHFAQRIIGLFYEEDTRWCNTAKLDLALAQAGFGPIRKFGSSGRHDVLAIPQSTGEHHRKGPWHRARNQSAKAYPQLHTA